MSDPELHEFRPDWTLRPGVLLGEELKARGWTAVTLTDLSGLDPAVVEGVLDGTRRIDGPAARGIGGALGTSAEMWLSAQQLFDEGTARGAADKSDDYREDVPMGELDAAARAAGYEVSAKVLLTHGADALLEVAGEGEPVRWPAAEVADGLGVDVAGLPGARVRVTVRETVRDGRVLSRFRPAGE